MLLKRRRRVQNISPTRPRISPTRPKYFAEASNDFADASKDFADASNEFADASKIFRRRVQGFTADVVTLPTRPVTVQSVLKYGAETWALKRTEKLLLMRTDARMIRWAMYVWAGTQDNPGGAVSGNRGN